jgi:hypothetical protein
VNPPRRKSYQSSRELSKRAHQTPRSDRSRSAKRKKARFLYEQTTERLYKNYTHLNSIEQGSSCFKLDTSRPPQGILGDHFDHFFVTGHVVHGNFAHLDIRKCYKKLKILKAAVPHLEIWEHFAQHPGSEFSDWRLHVFSQHEEGSIEHHSLHQGGLLQGS